MAPSSMPMRRRAMIGASMPRSLGDAGGNRRGRHALGQRPAGRAARRGRAPAHRRNCATAPMLQVSSRSPRPESPITVSGRAPKLCGNAAQLDEAARHHGGLGAGAEPGADDRAGGNRQHVLQRAADLDADQVVGRIAAEMLGRQTVAASPAARSLVAGRDDHRRRQAPGDIGGEARARQCGDRTFRAGSLRRSPTAACRWSARCPWRRAPAVRRPASGLQPRRARARNCCAGTTASTQSAPLAAPRRRRSSPAIAGSIGDAGQVARVLAALADRVDRVGVARPEPDIMAGAPHGDGQRRAPGAAAEHGDLAVVVPPTSCLGSAPAGADQRRGRLVERPARARREMHGAARRPMPARKRSMPAQAIIAALSVHSASGGATKAKPCRAHKRFQRARGSRALAATPPATTSDGCAISGNSAAEARQAAADAVVQRIGDRRLEGGADVGDILVATAARSRSPPAAPPSSGRRTRNRAAPRPSSGAGKRSAWDRRRGAAFSTFGPPG